MTRLAHLCLPLARIFPQRRVDKRDYICPVAHEREDVAGALARHVQIKFQYSPFVFDVSWSPKHVLYDTERFEFFDSIALRRDPFVFKLAQGAAPSANYSVPAAGTLHGSVPKRSLHASVAQRSPQRTEINASHEQGGDLLEDRDLSPEKVRAPARKWRNWGLFSVFLTGRCKACKKSFECKPGDIYGGCCFVWPSRDTAETYARENPIEGVKYLGAYPEGSRP